MGAFTLVLHIWTQDLRRHVQVHVLMACGGLDDEDHLSRYTHRVAVSNERIAGITGGAVRLRVRVDDHGGKRSVFIDGAQFIGRFLLHVLPPGFKRIRHYGLLSPALKTERLAPAGCRTAFARTRYPANACAHRLRLLPNRLPMTRAPHAGTLPSLKPTPEPYIPQEPRTPSPSGGPVQRGLPDAADIGSAVMLRCGVG